MESTDLKDLLPPGLKGKSDILYGNLGQIYCFHNQIILPALECCCSSSPESIARCFTENVLYNFHLFVVYFKHFKHRKYKIHFLFSRRESYFRCIPSIV